MTLLLLLILIATCCYALLRPAYGVIAYYVLSVARPQSIWPWVFQDLSATLLVSVAAIAGTLIAAARGELNLSNLNTAQAKCFIGLVVVVNLSHWFSPFEEIVVSSLSAAVIVSTFNKVVLFYFISVTTIQTRKDWMMLLYVLAGSALYFTYYANMAYFGGEYWKFGANGRLSGPGGMYSDENNFAVIFVVGLPIVFYLSTLTRNWVIKLALLAALPMMLHAILLTGSRGALLSSAMIGLWIALQMRSKFAALILLALGALFVLDQGGTVVNRVDSTVERQETLDDGEALDPRLISWSVGLTMLLDHPLLGVGAAKFETAAPTYRDGMRSVAHNTLLQFAANSGFFAGMFYLGCFWLALKDFRRERRSEGSEAGRKTLKAISRQMLSAALIGFLCASMFLDLMLYEIFYLLLALVLIRQQLVAAGIFDDPRDDPRDDLKDDPPTTETQNSA